MLLPFFVFSASTFLFYDSSEIIRGITEFVLIALSAENELDEEFAECGMGVNHISQGGG